MSVTIVGTVDHNELTATALTIAVTRVGIVPGNLIVVGVISLSFACTQVSDGTTTVSTPDVSINQASMSQFLALFSFPNHAGGTKTFTATYAGAATGNRGIVVLELQGAALTSPLEGIASVNNGFGSGAIDTGNLSPSPSVDGEYIVGYAMGANSITTGAGFTDLFNDATVNESDFEGLAQGAHAAIAPSWTHGSLGTWGAIAASYKPAGAGGGTTPVPGEDDGLMPYVVANEPSVVSVW